MWPTWRGRKLRPSLKADREMLTLRLDLEVVLLVLEDGFDCSRSPRSAGTVERCLRWKGKVVKVVAVPSVVQWNGEEIWLVIHVGEIHAPQA